MTGYPCFSVISGVQLDNLVDDVLREIMGLWLGIPWCLVIFGL